MLACPGPALLERFAVATCSADEGAAIERHLTTCSDCRALLDTIHHDSSLLGELRDACDGADLPSTSAPRVLPGLPGYRLIRQLGMGGMGVVYEAEQETPRRRVALKVLRGSAPSPRALRRFELEREVLARLEHPGIARIHAAGTYEANGERLPFFAMEMVAGEPLDDWLRREAPDRGRRLRLFAAICAAVEHAHRRGVVHRDLKPGNVLVTGEGEIKVVDFGVARVTDPALADDPDALRTEVGQLVGTLVYMSPEQVRGEPDGVDTRTDVWALGAMLFELLTGELPHDFDGLSRAEAIRRIAETTARRPGAIDRRCRGDLDTIVGKALRIDPDERYPSAGALGDDVTRYLLRQPIAAHPPSLLYQLRRFAARHRLLVAAALLVLLAFVAAFVVARRDRAQALLQASRAEAVVDLLKEVLLQADPKNVRDGGEPTIRDAVREAEVRMQKHIPDDPWVEAVVRHTLGKVQTGLGDYDDAQRNLERALVAFRKARANRQHVAGTLTELAELLINRGRFAAAEADAREVLALAGDGVIAPQTIATSHNLIGLACQETGRLDEAERHFQRALAMWRAIEGESNNAVAGVLANLGRVQLLRGQVPAAIDLYQQSMAITREVMGADHPQVATMLGKLALAHAQAKDPEAAKGCLREAIAIGSAQLGEHHPRLATSYYNLGHLLLADRPAEAVDAFGNALLAAKRKHEHHDHVLATLSLLAEALRRVGRREQALERLVELRDLTEAAKGVDCPDLFMVRAMIVLTADPPDRDEQLRAIEREALTRLEQADETARQPLRHALARVYEFQGRHDEAARLRR